MKTANNYTVFFDFDNTITTHDVLDDMLIRFSKDDRWVELEKMWNAGRIGSRECLRDQIKGIRISRARLDRYLSGIKLDPHFKRLLRFLNSKKIESVIVSDNFDYILGRILKKNGIRGLKVYSNRVKIVKDRLMPSFPSSNKACMSCAHCKNNTLVKNADKSRMKIYIGDGKSDICASKDADLVFAKDGLLDYFRSNNLPHVPFKGLGDVHDYLKRSIE